MADSLKVVMEKDREANLAQLADSNCRCRMFSQLHIFIIIDVPELDQGATSLRKNTHISILVTALTGVTEEAPLKVATEGKSL